MHKDNTLSPTMFAAAEEKMLKKLKSESGMVSGQMMSNLKFADDIILFANTENS